MKNYELLTGDCIDIMADMPENYIDLTVTSPPYDNLRRYNGFTFDYKKTLEGLYRATKPGGVVVWVVGDATIKGSETGTSFRQALFAMECGFNLHDTMIYLKNNPIPLTHNRYEQYFEYMFIFSKKKPKTFLPIMRTTTTAGAKHSRKKSNKENGSAVRNRNETTTTKIYKIIGNVWAYNCGQAYKTDHPAPFPYALARDHIISWSNAGDLIFDPFTGSGTTGKAALETGRRFIGCDISAEYIEIARNRIENAEAINDAPPA